MNDPRSMVIGWSALLLAAGTGYYFARKDLNQRRKEQTRQGLRGPALDWREKIEQSSTTSGGTEAGSSNTATSTTTSTPTAASSGAGPGPESASAPKAPP